MNKNIKIENSKITEYINKNKNINNTPDGKVNKKNLINQIFIYFNRKFKNDISALNQFENNLGMFLTGFGIVAEKSKNIKNIRKWKKLNNIFEKNKMEEVDKRIKTIVFVLNKMTLEKIKEYMKVEKVLDTYLSLRCAPEIGLNKAPVWNNSDKISKNITHNMTEDIGEKIYKAYLELEKNTKYQKDFNDNFNF
jgi:hypothetical protein